MSALPAGVVDAVRARLSREQGDLTPARVAAALREEGRPVGDATVLAVHDALRGDIHGAGLLDPLVRMPGVTDVLVNGPDHVYVDRGAGLERTPVRFADDEAVRRLAQRLAAAGGRRLDDATPYVDVRLPDGTRLHAVLAPIARRGTCVSLRVPTRTAFSLDDLVRLGSSTRTGAAPPARPRRRAAGLPRQWRDGLGQDDAAGDAARPGRARRAARAGRGLRRAGPDHPHVVTLEARPPNVETAGEVTVRDLVRQALRMRPDRLVVGEVRGAEVTELLAALNTGHEGGCGTIHANSAADVPARVEALSLAAGLPRDAAHSQFASAVDAVVHLDRAGTGDDGCGRWPCRSADRDGLVSMARGGHLPGRPRPGRTGAEALAARLDR